MELLLDFNGRRLQGERPFAVFEAKDDLWSFLPYGDRQSLAGAPSTGRGEVLLALRQALDWAKENSNQNGAALGFFAYDFARTQKPHAFPSPAPPDQLHLPDVRLVFFEELTESPLEASEAKPQTASSSDSAATPSLEYSKAIQQIHASIQAGDIYQANYAQQFSAALPCSPAQLYERLHCVHAAPFSAFLSWDDFAIVSNSPERFLKLEGRTLTTQPIKGTAPRGNTSAADDALKSQLQASQKNRAENSMVVDLLREELERVCEQDSVEVPQLFEIQSFPTLHHLVSTITGTLRAECDAIDAFAATFPCGSITGAPKIRSMQVIDELEGKRRGASFGNIGYFGFQGDMEWNVAIRTVTCKDGQAHFHAGGGIIAASDAASEYAEMYLKAKALLAALK